VLVVVVLDGGVVVGDERLLDQLQRDGRLADAPIAHNNQLKGLIEMLLGWTACQQKRKKVPNSTNFKQISNDLYPK
jgi:hypothetical protein